MPTHEEQVAEFQFASYQLRSRRDYQATRTLPEMALDLCHAIEGSPACAQQTKCSLLASELRRELEIYQDTRPLTDDEKAKIEIAWQKLKAIPLNPNR